VLGKSQLESYTRVGDQVLAAIQSQLQLARGTEDKAVGFDRRVLSEPSYWEKDFFCLGG
jgi:hypothetical protein